MRRTGLELSLSGRSKRGVQLLLRVLQTCRQHVCGVGLMHPHPSRDLGIGKSPPHAHPSSVPRSHCLLLSLLHALYALPVTTPTGPEEVPQQGGQAVGGLQQRPPVLHRCTGEAGRGGLHKHRGPARRLHSMVQVRGTAHWPYTVIVLGLMGWTLCSSSRCAAAVAVLGAVGCTACSSDGMVWPQLAFLLPPFQHMHTGHWLV